MILYPSPKIMSGYEIDFITRGVSSLDNSSQKLLHHIAQRNKISLSNTEQNMELIFRELDSEKKWNTKVHRIEPEAYILEILLEENNRARVTIHHQNKQSILYALQTLCQIIKSQKLFIGVIHDFPSFPIRGILEGFYGPPWTEKHRLEMISFLATHKMNTFVYAPKDDNYHREKWDLLYDTAYIEKLNNLYQHCAKEGIHLCYALGPGLLIRYSDNNQIDLLKSKYKQIFEIGVRHFGLFLDDIFPELQYKEDSLIYKNLAEAHADLISKIYIYLQSLDNDIQLFVCPTEYWKLPTQYTQELGQRIDPRIQLMWTGRKICSDELSSQDAAYFARLTNHLPLYWDNYPVNDLEMSHCLHIGPYIGREENLHYFSNGILANAMQYVFASQIAIAGIADYTWNAEDYHAENSWKNGIAELCGEKDKESFYYFADNSRFSPINREESLYLNPYIQKCRFLLAQGDSATAIQQLQEALKPLIRSLTLLEGMENKELFKEIRPWLLKYREGIKLLEASLEASLNKNIEKLVELEESFSKYMSNKLYIFADVLYPFLREVIVEKKLLPQV